jgi:hypothetical protein
MTRHHKIFEEMLGQMELPWHKMRQCGVCIFGLWGLFIWALGTVQMASTLGKGKFYERHFILGISSHYFGISHLDS